MTWGWKWRRVLGAWAALCTLGLVAAVSSAGGSGPTTLSGNIRVKNFVVPAGTVRVLDGRLNLMARGRIEIDGTLEIQGAHKMLLAAGTTLRIGKTGRVMAAPTAAAGSPPQVIKTPGLIQLQGS